MKNRVFLQQLTMNAGTELPMDFVVRHNLKNNSKYFEQVFIADGHLTDQARNFYSQFENVVGIDSPWNDSYVKQYHRATQEVPEGAWILHLDADELPSQMLSQFILSGSFDERINIVKLPCVLYLTEDNEHFYPVEDEPDFKFNNQWTKSILFKKTNSLQFKHFGSHVIPQGSHEGIYIPAPYYHLKSLQSFVENDVYQAFLSPAGQGYSEIESVQFKQLIRDFKQTKDFRAAAKTGTWSIPLQKFAWDHRRDFNRPISRLFWEYHILQGHKCIFGTDDQMIWANVKRYVQSEKVMQKFEEEKKNRNHLIIEKV